MSRFTSCLVGLCLPLPRMLSNSPIFWKVVPMRPLVILFVLTMSVSASTRAAAQVVAGPFFYGGHEYYQLENAGWFNSEAEAVSLGGHLVTINDAAENEWISQTFEGHPWTGFNDVNVEGTFEWVSGEPVTYTSWNPGEPNNSGGVEHFAKTRGDGLWNDVVEDGEISPGFPNGRSFGVVGNCPRTFHARPRCSWPIFYSYAT